MNPLKPNQKTSLWKNFAISLLLVILLFVSALFTGIYFNSFRAIEDELESRARSIFNSIVLTREWAAIHNGVYVKKSPGMQSNPYLENPDIQAMDGTIYTKKNPALMTREISEIAEKQGSFKFHITSLKPLNPDNAPDNFERAALEQFEQGLLKEEYVKEVVNDSHFFRYIAPLYTNSACLNCHQDYEVNDVRGGISVIFNIDKAQQAMRTNLWLITSLFFVTLCSFIGIVFRLVISFKKKMEKAEAMIRELAITDELTQLKNRRYVVGKLNEEFGRSMRYQRPLTCVLFDIDFFKRVNDNYGHDVGDLVLQQVSRVAQEQCRQSDSLGRYGGEEFLLVMPESDIEAGRLGAERFRVAIENLAIPMAVGQDLRVTASFGVACVDGVGADPAEISTPANLVKAADVALFKAKEGGRNRVFG